MPAVRQRWHELRSPDFVFGCHVERLVHEYTVGVVSADEMRVEGHAAADVICELEGLAEGPCHCAV